MRTRSFRTCVARSPLVMAVLIGSLVPAVAFARRRAEPPVFSQESTGTDDAVHATRGVVKTITGKTLVVSRPKNRGDIVFRLSPAVRVEGTIEVGATISVRYRDERNDHVAIAISAQKRNDRTTYQGGN